MAENKKSFILYTDLIHTVEQLSDSKAGILLKHLLRYVNDKNPETEDKIVSIAFEPIKQQLKRDLKDWNEVSINKSNGGKLGNLKRYNKDLYDLVVKKQITISDAEKIVKSRIPRICENNLAYSAVVAVTDNVTVTVSDTVNVNDNVIINDITDFEIGKTIEFVRLSGGLLLTFEQVKNFWLAFIIHAQGEVHENAADKIQHFRNWLKKQKINQNAKLDSSRPNRIREPL